MVFIVKFFFAIVLAVLIGSMLILKRKPFLKKTITLDHGSRYFFIPRKHPKHIQKVLIYFHGLQSVPINMESWERIAKNVMSYNVFPIFPVGLEGAFSKESESIAWSPGKFEENNQFVEKLIEYVNTISSSPPSIVLTGFSNGAYFLSKIMQRSHLPIIGYWLQGGIEPIEPNCSLYQKICLEVGEGDIDHLKWIRSQKAILQDICDYNKNSFLYIEFKGGHEFWLENFSQIHRFFWEIPKF